MAAPSLSSLHLDVWSECLKFLSPQDMVVASTRICRSLSHGEERAAWLALESTVRKAGNGHSSVKQLGTETAFTVSRYPGETWLGLYELFCSMLRNEATRYTAFDVDHDDNLTNDNDDGNSNSENEHIDEAVLSQDSSDDDDGDDDAIEIAKISWLLFGYGTPILPSESYPSTFCDRVCQESTQWMLRHRTRIISCTLRLSDVGEWKVASALLTALLEVDEELVQEGTSQVAQQERRSKNNEAEISTCICTFLIDRLYSSTFVRADRNDTLDLDRAVIFGRNAVRLCFQRQQENEETAQEQENGGNEADAKGPFTSFRAGALGDQPPLPVALFPSNSLRLAASRLALGKALALLAQHLGLWATRASEISVRPFSHVQNESEPELSKAFFDEGSRILEASIAALDDLAEEEENAIGPPSLQLLEMRAATRAALGELFYCKSSTHWIDGSDLRRQFTDDAIRNLKLSLRLVHEKLVIGEEIEPKIQALCDSSVVPRSLMLVQARTAKDLGKVYGFGRRYGLAIPRGESQKNFDFALAVNLRLHNDRHPSIANIRRLGNRSIDAAREALEDRVNQWMINPDCCLMN